MGVRGADYGKIFNSYKWKFMYCPKHGNYISNDGLCPKCRNHKHKMLYDPELDENICLGCGFGKVFRNKKFNGKEYV